MMELLRGVSVNSLDRESNQQPSGLGSVFGYLDFVQQKQIKWNVLMLSQ